ncbi:MAG: translation initiation factor IF-2 [Candidatus Wildermuthbacteria bacterium]|nr:translation initiation factor IF-2 [Candidatus Wildermuthbacteria bacterium]
MTTPNTVQLDNTKVATRPPIVVVLGHVDHGKSSLLEAIREDFRIISRESGGITQSIGAYQADLQGEKITFIDTPGHELFAQMRSRGAKVADIAILVVAADEGVKPQTVEAIVQIKKAGIPMVVAIHKIDKPEANAERVKQELAQHGVLVETYGGNVPSQETSATTKQGIRELLEMILLVAEIEDLKADKTQAGEGIIIESYMDARRGSTATIIVKNGVVREGDFIGTKTAGGKIRILEDFRGNHIQEALPSMPAIVLGFLRAPRVGEQFRIFEDEESVMAYVQEEKPKEKEHMVVLDSDTMVVNVVVKADTAGSLEAIEDVLRSLPSPEGKQVALRLLEPGVGEVLENDVKLARSSHAHIFCFRTKISNAAADLADRENIPIHQFSVIYELIQAARELLEKASLEEEGRKDLGALLVLAVFLTDKKRQVVGGKVLEGEVRKGVRAEIVRGGEIVGQGKITNVQHEKKDIPIATKGQECGLSVEFTERIQVGDQLQFFTEPSLKKA